MGAVYIFIDIATYYIHADVDQLSFHWSVYVSPKSSVYFYNIV